MVNLILETGVGLINSNSYVSLEYADEYFAGHAYHSDAWAEITDENRRKALLVAATQFIDLNFDWYGMPASETQSLEWPRYGVYANESYLVPDYTVPDRVRKAVCEQAFFMSKGDPNTPMPGVGITDLKIDVIELTFDKAVTARPLPGIVVGMLRGLAEYAYSRRVRKVVVG